MLEIKHLSFSVGEGAEQKEILHNINLTIDNGKFVGGTNPNPTLKTLEDLDKMSYDEYKQYRQGN